MTCCAYSCTQYGLHTQYMLLTHADATLCLQLHTVQSVYTVHHTNSCSTLQYNCSTLRAHSKLQYKFPATWSCTRIVLNLEVASLCDHAWCFLEHIRSVISHIRWPRVWDVLRSESEANVPCMPTSINMEHADAGLWLAASCSWDTVHGNLMGCTLEAVLCAVPVPEVTFRCLVRRPAGSATACCAMCNIRVIGSAFRRFVSGSVIAKINASEIFVLLGCYFA